MRSLSLATAASFLIASNSLLAAFTGGFDLGAPVNPSMNISGSTSFGDWEATTSISHVASTAVNTTGAPSQLILGAAGAMESDLVSIAELTFSSGTFSSDRIVSFDISLSGSGDWVAYFNYGGANVALGSGLHSYSFQLAAGTTLEFLLRATGHGTSSVEDGPGGPGGGFDDDGLDGPGTGVEGYPSNVSVTLTNFTATSVIPEPSTYALLFGGLALAGAALVRRRRG